MKRIAAILFCLVGVQTLHAQTNELTNAYTYFNLRQVDKAKDAIDKASANEKTKDLPRTWVYRSLIYSNLALDSTKKAQKADNYNTAKSSMEKARKLDTKNEYKADLDNAGLNLAQYALNDGVAAYKNNDFKTAEGDFLIVSAAKPQDTIYVLYTAISANAAKDYPQAIQSYSKLIKMNPKPNYYQTLASIQKSSGDTTGYFRTVEEGRSKFPNDNPLITEELNYYLTKGKSALVVEKLKNAIDKDPKNASLYVVLGSAYETLKKTDSAESVYKKALAIDPRNFEANFNLGALYYNRAAETLKKANKMARANASDKAYNAAIAKFKKQFEEATPYLEKAIEIKPDDRGALQSLKEIYVREKKTDKAKEMQRRLDALK